MIPVELRLRSVLRDHRGQIVPLVAVMMLGLVAVAGLVMDGGRMYWIKQRAQSAADAGATGGAFEIQRGNTDLSAEVRPAALNDVSLNGFHDTNSTIAVNNPPVSGPNAGDSAFVEVIVQQPVEMTFSRVFRREAPTVVARSVAGVVRHGDACVLTLNRTARAALRLSGNPRLQAGCGLMTNSAHPWAFEVDGHATLDATWAGTSGGYRENGASGSVTPEPVTAVPPMLDPFANLPTPNYSGWPEGSFDKNTGRVTCPGGQCVFSSRLKVSNSHAPVVFDPGTYVLLDGMQINSNGDVTASNVTFYTSGHQGVLISGSGTHVFTAPSSGAYEGILFFGDRSQTGVNNNLGRGTPSVSFRGVIYFPTQHVDFGGNFAGSDPWGYLIADTLDFSGTTDVTWGLPPADEIPQYMTAVMLSE